MRHPQKKGTSEKTKRKKFKTKTKHYISQSAPQSAAIKKRGTPLNKGLPDTQKETKCHSV